MRSPRTLRRVLAAGVLCLLPLPTFAADTSPAQSAAERALNDGRINDAVAALQPLTAANPRNSAAHLLLCRAFYAEEAGDDAVTECEAALATGGSGNATARDWMGRAYGLKANHAGLGGISLAKRVKIEFEAAVALDPHSVPAVNDLAEFYIGAPSMVGGDVGKALALADRVASTMPQTAHRIRGLAATDRHDYATAETELKAAVGAAGSPAAWVDLAAFYGKRKRYDDALATLRKAEDADRAHDPSLVDIGSIYLDIKRQFPEGMRVLRVYLGSGARTDAGPAAKAHFLIGKMLAKNGDNGGARQEYEAALHLAAKYESAVKALNAL